MANPPLLRSVDEFIAGPTHPERWRSPLVYWHLLSLDAPTVAMTWTWFIAATSGVRLPLASILAMGSAVWILYVADRLLDARTAPDEHLELRHLFHRNHRGAFHVGILVASLLLLFLITRVNPAAIRLYAILSAPLICYFTLIHVQRKSSTARLPKEIAVGVFFSAATFIPAVARNPGLRFHLLPAAVLFGLVCCLNCLFIYAWEHPQGTSSPYPEAHPATRMALRFLSPLSIAGVAGGLAFGLFSTFSHTSIPRPWQLGVAISLAATLLLQLNSKRHQLRPTALRAAGDLCLLTPILLTFALHL